MLKRFELWHMNLRAAMSDEPGLAESVGTRGSMGLNFLRSDLRCQGLLRRMNFHS